MGNQFILLERFRKEAEAIVRAGYVREIEFSGPTYLVEVWDANTQKTLWPFLQFDDKAVLKDAFCSCSHEEEGCAHLAAALLKIYNGYQELLHIRYSRSFWNAIGQIGFEHIGADPFQLEKKNKGIYRYRNDLFFEIHALSEAALLFLKQKIEFRKKETPETSLKFSALPQEEILHWREGRPSRKLRYELSYWSDLSKFWMMLQESGQKYRIYFYETHKLPLRLKVLWNDVHVFFSYQPNDLFELIPTLETVNAPLKIYRREENIQKILYDLQSRSLKIFRRTESFDPRMEGEKVGQWLYVKEKGFYSFGVTIPIKGNVVSEKDIPNLLDHYADQVAPLLKDTVLHRHPIALNFHLEFDAKWDLHLWPYLFEVGDLGKPGAALFGNWAFLPEKGFFSLQENLFKKMPRVVPFNEVSSFVNTYRIWLNAQKGFGTHLASVEAHLTYSINAHNELVFQSLLHNVEESTETKDFGDWIYFKGLGFFSKKYSRLGIAVRPGVIVSEQGVASFIRNNREELEAIPHFFSEDSPLEKRGFSLELHTANSVSLKPIYEKNSSFQDEEIRFFGDFVYLQGRGFYELSPTLRLPDRFSQGKIYTEEELSFFFEYELEAIKPFLLHIDPRLIKPQTLKLCVASLKQKTEGNLLVGLYYQTEYGKVDCKDIHQALQKKRRYHFSNAGRLDLESVQFQWIKQLRIQPHETEIELSIMEFFRVYLLENFQIPAGNSLEEQHIRALLQDLQNLSVPQKPEPKALKSHLRLYQKTGLDWLWFLYLNGLSGILCDDMGLGKTHQAMALIAAIMHQSSSEKRFLVVCPTSVIYHWQDKIHQFLPDITVYTFHGLKRSLKKMPKEGIILTSYGILRMEKKALKEIFFELAVFDEVQIAKNPHSRVHHALREIAARMRLGLTGTPIENNLRELKSLFDLILPGYMPQEEKFKEFFLLPIEKENDQKSKTLLSRFIHPFTLRRRKSEVLEELPEKTVDAFFCDLSEEQGKLYKELLQRSREQIFTDLKDDHTPIPYLHIFSLLSKLKQICNHPALFLKEPDQYTRYASGKWDLFVELMEETQESAQKVVIFSQYLQMLDIMTYFLKNKGWGFAQIRGSTTNRREEIQRFQEDPNCVVFIGSLQAAGLGIDLTAASVVIFYDRWWNAARENQAIDRVHRLGQKRGVQVYKLITKGTIEEKIDQMIERKGQLMDIVKVDDQSDLKRFTRSELIDLLTY